MAFYVKRIDIDAWSDEQILAAADRLVRYAAHGEKLHWGDEELAGEAIKMLYRRIENLENGKEN